jgi:hypothetical protein
MTLTMTVPIPIPRRAPWSFQQSRAFVLSVWLAVLSVFLAFGGCSSGMLPTAQTFDQKAVLALGTVTTIRQTATTLLKAKSISISDAENALTTTDAAAAGIVVARSLQASNPAGATSKLDSVVLVLEAVRTYLSSKGAAS